MIFVTRWEVENFRCHQNGLSALDEVRGKNYNPNSLAYFCRWCGEIWGRIEVEGTNQPWRAVGRPCIEHGNGLMMPVERCYWLKVPAHILRREIGLIAHAEHPEKYYSHILLSGGLDVQHSRI